MIGDRLLYSEAFRDALAGETLDVVDVGARGAVEEPWASMAPDLRRSVGFEPDAEECRRLNAAAGPGETYIPTALWSSDGEVDVHIADFPGCSSVHPPNFELLERFQEQHWRPRVTRGVVSYPATTLDNALAASGLGCDFLKIDTQGAEYEVLNGATATLEDAVFGVLVETWTSEVHSAQHLTGEVLTLMAERGFVLFDVNVAAAWNRASGGDRDLGGKRQIMGLDLLFFRDPPLWPEQSSGAKLPKAAAIADVYGFPDFALELLDAVAEDGRPREVAARMREHVLLSAAKPAPRRRVRLPGRSAQDPQREFASLHY